MERAEGSPPGSLRECWRLCEAQYRDGLAAGLGLEFNEFDGDGDGEWDASVRPPKGAMTAYPA